MRTLANDEQYYDVIELVSLSGEAGRDWALEFEESGCSSSMVRIQGALKAMWVGRLDHARSELDGVERDLEEAATSKSHRLLLGRWLHGVRAYLHYSGQDFELAEEALRTAELSVRDSIVAEPLLVPLAAHCADLRTQSARLARRRRRWAEMKDRLREARGMYTGEVPFCELPDGTSITSEGLLGHLIGLPMEQHYKDVLVELFDRDGADHAYEQFERHMYVLPGMVSSYP